MSYEIFKSHQPLLLESGETLPGYHLAHTTYGKLNSTKNNAVWIFHALTANSDPAEWWPGLVGPGKLFDPEQYFIVCVNMPGSCYGSIGPLSINPETKQPYYRKFPFFTTRDMIHAYQPLREHLGIQKIEIGIGGSMGGQQLMEWAGEEPSLFNFIFPVATNTRHSPWGIAFNTAQRMSIEADPTWNGENEQAGINGMKAARAIALLSYRNYNTYGNAQTRNESFPFDSPGTADADGLNWSGAASYQRYQGEKLAKRFNAFSYYRLSQSMDSHDIGRGRESVEKALHRISAKTLVIGIKTDILFPLEEQQLIAAHIPGAHYTSIDSTYGHDGFLLEYESISRLITEFINKETITNPKFAAIH